MMYRLRLLYWLFWLVLTAGCGGGAVEPPDVLYLRADPGEAAQLFRQPPGDAAIQVTGVDDPTAPEVIDFAASPDGARIVYSTTAADGSALWLVDADGGDSTLLLECPAAECSAPVWSPDGRRLLYERRPLESGVAGSPRLHWLDAATGATQPLLEGDETPGYGARFSPDGAWLSYVSPADEGVVLYRLADGTQRLLSSRVGSPAAWRPDGAAVIVGDLATLAAPAPETDEGATPVEESAAVYLYRTGVDETEPRQRLSPDAAVVDSVPAWSPDGVWIAFGRVPAGAGAARQLWLMRPDGSAARALTDDPAIAHGPPSWSADGRFLLYQRYDTTDPVMRPSVWRLDVMTGEAELVAESGFLPAWLNR